MFNDQHDTYLWRSNDFFRHIQVLGFALIAVSILYLTAANWFMLPQIIQLSIPQLFLLSSALASAYVAQRDYLVQCLHTVSGLMIGLSLAVIGQIYQTGADSYLLFLIWSILLLPWLYRPNIGVFTLVCVLSQLTVFLFFKQTFWLQEYPLIFLLSINLLSLFQFYFCLRSYQKLRYFFILWFGILSIWHMVLFLYGDLTFDHTMLNNWINLKITYLISSLFLLSIASTYFYRKKDQLCSILCALSLGITLTFVFFKWMDDLFYGSKALQLFLIALVVFTWFALITLLFVKCLPQNKFNNIPIAVGAWVAGIILASMMLTFWGNFSLVFGLCFVLGSALILKQKQTLFLRQLAYCLWVAGQTAVLFHTFKLTEQFALILLLQLPLLYLSYALRTYWFFIFIQLFALYLIGIALIGDLTGQFTLHNSIASFSCLLILQYGFYLALIWVSRIQFHPYRRSLVLVNLLIIILSVGSNVLYRPYAVLDASYPSMLSIGLPALWFILFMSLRIRHQFDLIAQSILVIFAAVLIFYGYFEIFICIAILSWALSQQDKIIYSTTLITIVLILGFIYYSLNAAFLIKSLSIFSSGLILLLLAWMLHQHQMKEV